MAEIWLEMVVKRQLVSLLLFETPSRMDRRSFLIMLTELQDSNPLDKSDSKTHLIEEKAGSYMPSHFSFA